MTLGEGHGSIFGSGIKGENPNSGVASNVIGTVVGYNAGKVIEKTVGKQIDPRSWSTPDWQNVGLGVSKWNAPSGIPGAAGGVGASAVQEPVGNKTKDMMDGKK